MFEIFKAMSSGVIKEFVNSLGKQIILGKPCGRPNEQQRERSNVTIASIQMTYRMMQI